jgi:hypothetical protein
MRREARPGGAGRGRDLGSHHRAKLEEIVEGSVTDGTVAEG